MTEAFLHGQEFIEISDGIRPVKVNKSAVVGNVGGAGGLYGAGGGGSCGGNGGSGANGVIVLIYVPASPRAYGFIVD